MIIGNLDIPPNYLVYVPKNKVHNNVITGLYTNKTLANGYSGYYHYYPDENIYMTGKVPSNQSQPIFDNKLSKTNEKNKKKVQKIAQKKRLDLYKENKTTVSYDKYEEVKKNELKYKEFLPEKTQIPITRRTVQGRDIAKKQTTKRTQATDKKGKY